jgi:glycosyltransferase involved in cell wall biosynthesis
LKPLGAGDRRREQPDRPARVLLWGTYDTGKPRVRILRSGLQTTGVHIEEIHARVWEGVEDKSQVSSGLARARLLLRWALSYPRLAWRLLRAERADLVLVGYPGILDILVAAPIARLRRMPIVWDMFISVYDTVCEDRRLIAPGSLAGRLLHHLERVALRLADAVFMDTHAHARRVEALFGLAPRSCGAVWVGVERDRFAPAERAPAIEPGAPMQVLFYGQFIPLHGIGVIVDAARRLRDAPVEWLLVGRGQEAERIRAELDKDPLPRLRWTEWVDYHRLREWLASADLCLGIFGTSDKAASVIPNKVFQIVAAGRPLVTRDSDAIRELLASPTPCTYLVPAGDGAALAEAVLAHRRVLEEEGAIAGCHEDLASSVDAPAIGRQFVAFVQERLGLWTTC